MRPYPRARPYAKALSPTHSVRQRARGTRARCGGCKRRPLDARPKLPRLPVPLEQPPPPPHETPPPRPLFYLGLPALTWFLVFLSSRLRGATTCGSTIASIQESASCSISGCAYKFSSRAALITHERRTHGLAPLPKPPRWGRRPFTCTSRAPPPTGGGHTARAAGCGAHAGASASLQHHDGSGHNVYNDARAPCSQPRKDTLSGPPPLDAAAARRRRSVRA
jgi:hypothetical protein